VGHVVRRRGEARGFLFAGHVAVKDRSVRGRGGTWLGLGFAVREGAKGGVELGRWFYVTCEVKGT
jgi:hypothetical protein